jgi:hypothetical protein
VVEVAHAVVELEHPHDGRGGRLVLVERDLQVVGARLPGLLDGHFLFDAGGLHQDVGAQLGLVFQPFHDQRRREVPHEVLGRTPTDLEAVLDHVSEEALAALAQLRGAGPLFGGVLLQVLHELLEVRAERGPYHPANAELEDDRSERSKI